MASRNIITPHSVIHAQSMGANITSDVTIIQNISMISYDISWSGGSTPIGEVVVEVSNSYAQNQDGSVKNAGNWTQLVLSATTNVSGNTGNGFIDIEQLAAYAIRIRYVRTSGSGTMNAIVAAKVA